LSIGPGNEDVALQTLPEKAHFFGRLQVTPVLTQKAFRLSDRSIKAEAEISDVRIGEAALLEIGTCFVSAGGPEHVLSIGNESIESGTPRLALA
jgi:hypothetical protein